MPWKEKNQAKIKVPEGIVNTGAYRNLMNQLNKTARHNRQGSFETRDRYFQAMDQFIRHCTDKYNLQKINNISGKHLASYIRERQEQGIAPSTIKSDISAIRFFHDKLERTRYILPDNKELEEGYGINLEKRVFGGVDRAWSDFEYQGMLMHAKNLNRPEISNIIQLAREQGLRVHEAIRIDRRTAEKALRENNLTIKGKGGKIRTIPLREEGRSVLRDAIKGIERGEKLFVPEGKKAHQIIESVQNFIKNHREKFAEDGRETKMTIHGCRHAYAREEYDARIENGMSKKLARLEVANLLGHERDEVTRIYI
jgi:integrase/recombinase XerD